jgi:hypothetical protein
MHKYDLAMVCNNNSVQQGKVDSSGEESGSD